MAMKEELEFINVQQDDEESMTQTYRVSTDGTEGESADSVIGNWIFKQSKHPVAIFFHLLFKSLALFIYIFGSWFTSNFIFTFVLCIILIAFDFWTVKNVSGRLLVGLRWWSYVREDGSNEWIFESLEDMAELSPTDSRMFWTTLYGTPIVWALLLVIGILRLQFEYLPVVVAAISMSMANIMGYMKCSNSAKQKMETLMQAGMKHGSLAALDNSSVRNWLFSTLLSVSANAATPAGNGAQSNNGSRNTTVV